jgi:hypothetical protein
MHRWLRSYELLPGNIIAGDRHGLALVVTSPVAFRTVHDGLRYRFDVLTSQGRLESLTCTSSADIIVVC